MKNQGLMLIAMLLALLVWAGRTAGADVVLVENGTAKAVIVTFTDSPTCSEAAKELQGYLEKMSGAILPVTTKAAAAPATTTRILVGLAEDLADNLKRGARETMNWNGFRLLAEAPKEGLGLVVIAGHDNDGLRFGVYEFLESLGCRWYFPGELGEHVPRRPTVRVRAQDEVHNPDLVKRSIGLLYGGRPKWQDSQYETWYRRNRMGGLEVQMGHALHYIIPPAEFAEDHPEYFPLWQGRRHNPIEDGGRWQPCTSNPDVIEIAARKAISYFAGRKPDRYAYSISPNDGYGWCQCDRCTAQDPPKSRGNLRGGKGRRMVLFANAVAERLARKFPDKYVCFYAYRATLEPPKDLKVHPNVIVAIAHHSPYFDPIRAVQDRSSKSNRQFLRVVNAWSAIAGKLVIREYWTLVEGLARTCPAYSLAEDIPFFKSKGVIGIYSESTPDYGAAALTIWLAGRLMWDTEADTEELMRDFHGGMYGPAAAVMRRYSDSIVSIGRGRGEDAGAAYTDKEFQTLGALLEKAAQLATTEKQRQRVRMTRDYYECTLGLHRLYTAPSAAKAKAVAALVHDLERRQSFAVDFVRHNKEFGRRLVAPITSARKYCGAKLKPYSREKVPRAAKKSAFMVRGRATFVTFLKAGETLRGRLEVRQLRNSWMWPTILTVLGPDKKTLLETGAPVRKPVEFRTKAKQTGVHVLAINTGGNGVTLSVENQYFCMVTHDGLGLLYAQPRAYFFVPPDAEKISMTLTTSSPTETGSMTVYDPRGKEISRGDTSKVERIEMEAQVAQRDRGKAWSVHIDEAPAGNIEDLQLVLGPGCEKLLATDPARLLVPAE